MRRRKRARAVSEKSNGCPGRQDLLAWDLRTGSAGATFAATVRRRCREALTMFQRILMIGVAAAMVGGLASLARAESVQLRGGASLEGDVSLEGPDTVVVDARFPAVKVVRLKRSELTPESLFSVLERRTDAKNPLKRRELGQVAETLGLLGAAVAEYRAAASLDASLAKEMDAKIEALIEEIAAGLLGDAKDLLDEGKSQAAIRNLHSLLERYPKSRAAKGVQALMGKAHEAAGTAAETAKKTVDAAGAEKIADAVLAHLQKGEKARAGVAGHEGAGGAADQRAILRAIDHYEDAWAGAKKFPVTETGNAELNTRLGDLHAKAKASLVQAYLTAGTMLLERRAIPSAERYCNKACELDPENKANHDLHRLIIEAKINSYSRRGRQSSAN